MHSLAAGVPQELAAWPLGRNAFEGSGATVG